MSVGGRVKSLDEHTGRLLADTADKYLSSVKILLTVMVGDGG